MKALAFELPSVLEAREPPEARGRRRDQVKLLVAERASRRIAHRTFGQLPDLLRPGDLLVVNVSATLPAAIPARCRDGSAVRVHVATRAPSLDASWRVVELRSADGARPTARSAGEVLALPGRARLHLVAPYASGRRLILARFHAASSVEDYLARHGEPIRYGYVRRSWPLGAYQNVYATTPGSAEMASAGRPFSPELITALIARGIRMAPVLLHAGVSSPERHEAPIPEMFEVPETTAQLVNASREGGGRVIAVGTTVVRALETVVDGSGRVQAGEGWTSLVVTPERGVRAVDGLITGWHEPEASHLQMLEAIAGAELLRRSYDQALAHRYLWHEFGDSHLVL